MLLLYNPVTTQCVLSISCVRNPSSGQHFSVPVASIPACQWGRNRDAYRQQQYVWLQVEAALSGSMDGRLSCSCQRVHSSCFISTVRLSLQLSVVSHQCHLPRLNKPLQKGAQCPLHAACRKMRPSLCRGCLVQAHACCQLLSFGLIRAQMVSVLAAVLWSHQTKQSPLFCVTSDLSRCTAAPRSHAPGIPHPKAGASRCVSIPWLQRGRGLVVSKHPNHGLR